MWVAQLEGQTMKPGGEGVERARIQRGGFDRSRSRTLFN